MAARMMAMLPWWVFFPFAIATSIGVYFVVLNAMRSARFTPRGWLILAAFLGFVLGMIVHWNIESAWELLT